MRDGDDVEWEDRLVAANGARFHLVETGTGPLVLLLHGFPEFWWAWRHQLTPIARAGYRAVAMDLRGYGRSDKTPRGYDPLTLAGDVAGVIRSLGARNATLVGQGWGGYVAWATTASSPAHVRALCSVGAPHPLVLMRPPFGLQTWTALKHLLEMQVPWLPERRIVRSDYVDRHLAAWAAPQSPFPSAVEVGRYREALSQWPSPHCALEFHRWLFRSRMRADGRAFAAVMRRLVAAPVMQINGSADPVVRRSAVEASARFVAGRLEDVVIPDAGHFPHEEAPAAFNAALLGWLSDGAGPGTDRTA